MLDNKLLMLHEITLSLLLIIISYQRLTA